MILETNLSKIKWFSLQLAAFIKPNRYFGTDIQFVMRY